MISIRPLGLAALIALGAPVGVGAQCREWNAARSFRLDLDWERATHSGVAEERGRLFPAVSSRLGRPAVPECFLAAALDRPRLILAGPSPAAPATSTQTDPDPDAGGPAWLKPFTFFVSLSGAYDSNINHDEDEDAIRAYGGALGAGVWFETDDVELLYEVTSHSYSHAEDWSRISHRLEAEYETDISKKLEFEAIGEFALKGSSDDRDLGDEYVLKPRLNYELSDSQRLRLYGAYRLRRYGEIDPLRDANNYYAGLEFRQRLGSGHLEVGYRWETNRSRGTRSRYKRQTYSAEYWTRFSGGRHELDLEFKYRPQQYEARFIDDEEEEGLRRDVRWIFTAAPGFALSRHFSIHPTYRFEMRTSNDPEEKWKAHLGSLSLRYTFGGSRAVARNPSRLPSVATGRDAEVERDDDEERGATAEPAHAAASPRPSTPEATQSSPQPSTTEVKTASRAAPRSRAATSPRPSTLEARKTASGAAPRSRARTVPAPARDPSETWVRRAEADRRVLGREVGIRYSIELAQTCDTEALARVSRHDAAGDLWLLPDSGNGGSCFRVFWGRYPTVKIARYALSTIPPGVRASGSRPSVIVALGR